MPCLTPCCLVPYPQQKDKAMEATRAELREAEQAQEEQDQVIQHLKQVN